MERYSNRTVVDDRDVAGTLAVPDPADLPDQVVVHVGGEDVGAEYVRVPRERLVRPADEQPLRYRGAFAESEPVPADADGIVRIPVAEEELHVRTRERQTGRVRLHKEVHTHTETVDEPLLQEEVVVERVPVDRVVDGPVETRREGETLVIPLVEERLVIRKELVLTEELHVRKRQTERHAPQEVTLRREEVEVERISPDDGEAAP